MSDRELVEAYVDAMMAFDATENVAKAVARVGLRRIALLCLAGKGIVGS
jgi:hypothetical protein